jgi:hypothetical protein
MSVCVCDSAAGAHHGVALLALSHMVEQIKELIEMLD